MEGSIWWRRWCLLLGLHLVLELFIKHFVLLYHFIDHLSLHALHLLHLLKLVVDNATATLTTSFSGSSAFGRLGLEPK